jgi:hypothetical protein
MLNTGLLLPYKSLAKTERKLRFLRNHFANHDPVTKMIAEKFRVGLR